MCDSAQAEPKAMHVLGQDDRVEAACPALRHLQLMLWQGMARKDLSDDCRMQQKVQLRQSPIQVHESQGKKHEAH